jgi:hypothetical protein
LGELFTPPMIEALPGHWLWWPGTGAGREGEEPIMEGTVMGEKEFDPASMLASLLALSLSCAGAAPLASLSPKNISREPPAGHVAVLRRMDGKIRGSWCFGGLLYPV